ncbi:MAG: DUF1804 family protein [Magnetospirillum sp.]|nr:DUF1804 family protein [Magnetospirillum sp.]
MAHAPETKAAVRDGYVSGKLTLERAAAAHDVPLATVRKWKSAAERNGDDWDRARAAHSLTTSGASSVAQLVLHDFLMLHESAVEALRADTNMPALARAEAMAKLADAFTKTMAAVAKAAPDLGRFAVAAELLQDFAAFVRERFPAHALALAEVLEPFSLDIARKYG